jgi:hypothetical protein
MTNENDFEVKYISGAVIKGILETPEAAELALDELRRDPISGNTDEHLTEIEQKHGTDVLEYYGFYFQVINKNEAFFEIDFDPRVDEAIVADTTQQQVEEEIVARFKESRSDKDITPEIIISRSKRANMLRMVAVLAIQDRIQGKKSKPKIRKKEDQSAETIQNLVLASQQ